MKDQKINLLTYGLLVASIIGSILDRPSRALEQPADELPLTAHQWQSGEAKDDDEHTIITTRFLFPEKPKKPVFP